MEVARAREAATSQALIRFGVANAKALRQCDCGGELSVQPCERDSRDLSGLMGGEARRRADSHLAGGYGGMVEFELEAGRHGGREFVDSLKMLFHVANIGDARSLAIHPATTTHSQLTPEEQSKTGVTDDYVRLSIGIEHIDDIIADLDQAFAVV